MGRKARRTKWRTLDIADEQSDSEESNETSGPRLPKAYPQKSFHSKFPYSSQSTPRRRYQHDGAKSTRSSSTASETKITFNEDEYTRITTPRQDVLFKKGYLNKPKIYQSQTSTGTSTTSTGNSTGNGTPDHHSTDLEYESQFVFPNGFLDQNGIYYVNSYEPYPLMLYNPQTYYTEVSNGKTKRYSTDSLTESTSPNNEEATSQDMSGGEASNNVSDYSGHHHVYNMVYPGYYVNGVCPSQDHIINQNPPDQTRRIKKLRRRKSSRSQVANNNDDSSDFSEDESECGTERTDYSSKTKTDTVSGLPDGEVLCNGHTDNVKDRVDTGKVIENEVDEIISESIKEHTPVTLEMKVVSGESDCSQKPPKYDLKPDAEEFIPRAYRTPEIPLSPVQFIKVPPNFVPIPVVPFNGQNFNPAFIPPGVPVNFLPPDPKMFPNFVGFVHPHPTVQEITPTYQHDTVENCDNENTAKEDNIKIEKCVESAPTTVSTNTKSIDIATVVSKLEEAVKEQNSQIEEQDKPNLDITNNAKRNGFVKSNRLNQRYRNHKRNYYNSVQNSPQRFNGESKANGYHGNGDLSYQNGYTSEPNTNSVKDYSIPNTLPHNENNRDNGKYIRNSPDKFKKNWKPNFQNGIPNKPHVNGVHKMSDYRQKPHLENGRNKYNKYYSDSVKQNGALTINGESHHEKTPESPKVTQIQNGVASIESSPTKIVSSQWISVSNRKKRKNKLIDENDTTFEDHNELQRTDNDLFESYDVNLLVDVIPVSKDTEDSIPKPEENTLKTESAEQKVEEIINIVVQNESEAIENISLSSEVKSVTEIEDELVVKPETESVEEMCMPTHVNADELKEVASEETVDQCKPKLNKKSKKGTQKSVVKRVMITDVDLSETCEEIKTPIKKVVCKISKPAELEKPCSEETQKPAEDEEKKKNKKRKKKSSSNRSEPSNDCILNSSSTVTPNDFLLDEALAVNAESKTNDEISQELDKIIQKGMYSSLEEKIKSLNIDEGDGFFKSVFSRISTSRESSVEKMGFSKTPDFSRILQNTRSMFKPASVSEEIDLTNTTTNSLLPDLDSTPADGIFLENPTLKEILPNQPREESNNDDDGAVDKSEVKTLYPITEAVKEWMCRTRETTPDVEILKSPAEIFQEFYGDISDSETDTEVKNISDDLSASIEDEEVTLFVSQSAHDSREGSQEILEYWEDDIHESSERVKNVNISNTDPIEEAEEPIEVYESKYGQNEDFLNLQREIQEKTQRLGPTKNSDLPHRAICCSIM